MTNFLNDMVEKYKNHIDCIYVMDYNKECYGIKRDIEKLQNNIFNKWTNEIKQNLISKFSKIKNINVEKPFRINRFDYSCLLPNINIDFTFDIDISYEYKFMLCNKSYCKSVDDYIKNTFDSIYLYNDFNNVEYNTLLKSYEDKLKIIVDKRTNNIDKLIKWQQHNENKIMSHYKITEFKLDGKVIND